MHHCTLSSDRSGSAYAAFALVGSPPSTVAAAVTAGRCRTWLSRDGAQQRENVGNEAGTGVRLPWTRQRCQSACSDIASANVRASSRAPKNLFFHARKKESGTGAHTRGCGANASTPLITSPRVFFRSPPLRVSPPRVAPPRFGMPSNVGGAPAASHTQHTSLEFEQIPSNHLVLTARSHGGVVRRVATSCAMTVLILLCIYFDTAHSPHSFAVALSSWERAYEITAR